LTLLLLKFLLFFFLFGIFLFIFLLLDLFLFLFWVLFFLGRELCLLLLCFLLPPDRANSPVPATPASFADAPATTASTASTSSFGCLSISPTTKPWSEYQCDLGSFPVVLCCCFCCFCCSFYISIKSVRHFFIIYTKKIILYKLNSI